MTEAQSAASQPLPAGASRSRPAVTAVYRVLLGLFVLAGVVELFLAGLGVFRTQHAASKKGTLVTTATFDHNFHPHLVIGDVAVAISLGIFVLAALARVGKVRVLLSLALFVDLAVGAALASGGPNAARALHPVLGVLALALAGYLLREPTRQEPRTADN